MPEGIAFLLEEYCEFVGIAGIAGIAGRIIRNDKAGDIDHQQQSKLHRFGL
jgi:hypothetical protein